MPNPEELAETYRRVRSILVSHRIDLGFLTIHVGPIALTITGRLQRLAQVDGPLNDDVIEAILGELRRVQGVRSIMADFENWKQPDGRHWLAVEALGRSPPPLPSPPAQPQPPQLPTAPPPPPSPPPAPSQPVKPKYPKKKRNPWHDS